MNPVRIEAEVKAKGLMFSALIPGLPEKRYTASQAESDHGSVAQMLTNLSAIHKINPLPVQLYARNGSSHIKKGFFLVEINRAVENINGTVENINNTVEKSNNTVENINRAVEKSNKAVEDNNGRVDVRTQIENARLTEANRHLLGQLDDTKQRLRKEEERSGVLFNETLDLQRKLASQKDRLELEYATKKLELEKDRQGGLSGLVGELNENPELVKALIGLINPKHPMFDQNNQALLSGGCECPKHPEADGKMIIDTIVKALITQKVEVLGMLQIVIGSYLMKPALLKEAYDKFMEQNKS